MHLAWQLEFVCNRCQGSVIINDLPFVDYKVEAKIPLSRKYFECPTCHENHYLVFMVPTLRPDTPDSVIIKNLIQENENGRKR